MHWHSALQMFTGIYNQGARISNLQVLWVTGKPCKRYQWKTLISVGTLLLQGYCREIPAVSLKQHTPYSYYWFWLNILQGLLVIHNPCKFEITAVCFPRKSPVNPCKHLQCTSYFFLENKCGKSVIWKTFLTFMNRIMSLLVTCLGL